MAILLIHKVTNLFFKSRFLARLNHVIGTIFAAKTAYDCLTSVPFNPAVASRFIQYYNDTLQFQSTLAYLKNPPASYQQPSVDLFKGLEEIQENIALGRFPNQYAFEATLQRLILLAHDSHINLVAGVLSAFTFASPYGIVSVSSDGVQIPKVYIVGAYILSREPSMKLIWRTR